MRNRTKKQTGNRRDIPHLTARLFGVPLLMDERKIETIYPIFEQKILHGTLSQKSGDDDDYREPGDPIIDTVAGIATIPIIGSLVRRSSWLNAYSGLTAYPDIADSLDCALADARVRAILLQVDSFGGEAGGCFELCERIYAARSIKPIWAIADIDALSAGYAILSSAERCFVAARGSVGSIGVVSVHLERSRQNEMMGLTYTVFRAGQEKANFNPYEKLTPAAAAKQIASMERTRAAFVDCVTRNRPISAQAVYDTEGQWYDAEDGLSLGLVDGIDTFENVFAELVSLVAPGAAAVTAAPLEPEADPAEADENDGDEGDDPPSEETPPDDDERGNIMDPKDAKNGTAAATGTVTAPASENVVTLADAKPDTAAAEIANMCILAGVPQRAAGYIANGRTVGEVRTELLEFRAKQSNGDGLGELGNHHTGTGNGGINLTGPATAHNNGPPKPETLSSWQGAFAKVHASNPLFGGGAARP